MNKRYIIELGDRVLDEAVKQQSREWAMTKKDFAKHCCRFFTRYRINPETYNPNNSRITQESIQESTALLLAKLDRINQDTLGRLTEEVLRCRLWTEALSSQITELLVREEDKDLVSESILRYIEENISRLKP